MIPDEICMYWHRVYDYECPQPQGCDSINVDTLLYGYLDVDLCCDPVGDSCIKRIEEWQCPSQFEGAGVWNAGQLRIVYGTITVEVPEPYMCGDANNTQDINILDIVYLINYKYKDGPEPPYMESSDLNGCDGYINILDVVYLVNFKYKNGPAPACCGN